MSRATACVHLYALLLHCGREPIIRPQYNVPKEAALGVIGFMVGYQAYRIRLLTRYFEKDGEERKDEGTPGGAPAEG